MPKNAAQSPPQSAAQSPPQAGDAPRGSLLALLRRHEGVRARLYQDSLGYWTIGVGHVVDRRKGGWCDDGLAQRLNAHGFCLSERVINAYLADDLAEAEQTIWDLLSPPAGLINQPRYEALVSMAFNLGRGGFAGFKKARAALEAGDWQRAHDELLDSRWAKQVPNRARDIASTILTGQAPS